MKVACISASQVPSNTANSIQVMKACQGLVQLGHAVSLSVPFFDRHPPIRTDLQTYYGLQIPIPIEWLPANLHLRRYDLAWRAVRDARVWRADLIYTWLPQAAMFGLLYGLPVALELHGPPEGRFSPLLFRLLFRLPGKLRLLPITQALVDILADYLPSPQSSSVATRDLVISPNGIDLERFSSLPEPAAARHILNLPELPTAAYTGHMYAGRGTELLFSLARRLPQVQFLWVGGREADIYTWRKRLEANGVSNVHLTGFIQNRDLPLYQAAAEVLLMPYDRVITGSSGGNSARYASPMKMFEYMASCRAIVSSDLPVLREVLNETNAVLCPPEDEEAWHAVLSSLLTDESRRLALARQAWQDVQPHTWLERSRRALADFP